MIDPFASTDALPRHIAKEELRAAVPAHNNAVKVFGKDWRGHRVIEVEGPARVSPRRLARRLGGPSEQRSRRAKNGRRSSGPRA
jgi:hypothetical protein